MGVRVVSCDATKVRFTAPLAANISHHAAIFGWGRFGSGDSRRVDLLEFCPAGEGAQGLARDSG